MNKIVKVLNSIKDKAHKFFDDVTSSSSQLDPDTQEGKQKLSIGNLIGFGNFSIVCAGLRWTPDGYESVAVKIPRADVNRNRDGGEREILIMKELGKHDFVLELIGTVQQCSVRSEINILTTFCANGSLKSYLKALNSNESDEQEVDNVDKDVDRFFELVKFSFEIASGMSYISSKNIIHGDLAARNVLLDERKICKIADFGLSRFTSSNLAETGERVEIVEKPWRWMAPEFLEEGLFTPSCDVWSFGVTIWEIFTLGKCPFSTLNWNAEFMEGIQSGRIRLEKPEMADKEIFDILEKCWNSVYRKRPGFSYLLDFFQLRYNLLRADLSDEKRLQIEHYQPTKIQPHVAFISEQEFVFGLDIPKEKFHLGVVYTAFEFCENGSLLQYLRNLKKKRDSNILTIEHSPSDQLKVTKLAKFSWEIASAMSYLSVKGIIHNAICARNVLLDKNKTSKLCDFSLSCGLNTNEQFTKLEQGLRFWRFLAIEVFEKRERSIKTDVWAYGVTLWEIFSLGNVPFNDYHSLSNEFVNSIKYKGLRLSQKEMMTAELYERMEQCWDLKAERRPTFESLGEFFKDLSGSEYYLELEN